MRQRWFPHTQPPLSARLVYTTPLSPDGEDKCFIAEVEIPAGDGQPQRLFVPVALIWSEEAVPPIVPSHQHTLARIRRSAEAGLGLLADAFAVPAFAHAIIQALREDREIAIAPAGREGVLRFRGEAGLAAVDLPADAPVKWFAGDQSNSSLSVGDGTNGGKVMLKLVRRLNPGVNPEAEMTRRLTQLEFANSPALLGEVIREESDGTCYTLALVHRHIANEGDAWSWTLDYLKRTLDNATRLTGASGASLEEYDAELAGYAAMASTIGRRLAELHSALAAPADDPAFSPERADSAQAQQHAAQAIATLHDALRVLAEHRRSGGGKLDGRTLAAAYADADADAEWLENHVEPLTQAIRERACLEQDSLYLRIHGEPARPFAERRTKTTPLRDVAGLLRSFDYAAAVLSPPGPLGSALLTACATETLGIVNKPMVLEPAPQLHASPIFETSQKSGPLTGPACTTETFGIMKKPMVSEPAPQLRAPPEPAPPQLLRREALLSRFIQRARSAFMQGYHAVAHQAPHPWLKPGAEQSLLELALLERAAYEVCYEAAHRPDWLCIPAASLAELARGILASPSSEKEAHES
ncbi:unnamed protein product [Closterium sp. NIES-64]|nr:unnamed protein product [Closterium sp. NIES-64]